jgi:hypothetical protein
MKFLLAIIAILSIASVYGENPFGLSDYQMEAIATIDSSKLPAIFQARRDNSHWCCSNEQPIQTEQKTKVVQGIHTVATKVKTGYTQCGFMNTMSCSLYQTKYKQVPYYHVQSYDVPVENACLDHHVVCCNGYMLVGGNCFGK